mmetsp:Transcript_14440/g.43043  ORF Transcript_14440/g.43043 Transcript_14440/m.43043 type:complete len:180 (-) Transcript_14440:631-1170(-)
MCCRTLSASRTASGSAFRIHAWCQMLGLFMSMSHALMKVPVFSHEFVVTPWLKSKVPMGTLRNEGLYHVQTSLPQLSFPSDMFATLMTAKSLHEKMLALFASWLWTSATSGPGVMTEKQKTDGASRILCGAHGVVVGVLGRGVVEVLSMGSLLLEDVLEELVVLRSSEASFSGLHDSLT